MNCPGCSDAEDAAAGGAAPVTAVPQRPGGARTTVQGERLAGGTASEGLPARRTQSQVRRGRQGATREAVDDQLCASGEGQVSRRHGNGLWMSVVLTSSDSRWRFVIRCSAVNCGFFNSEFENASC